MGHCIFLHIYAYFGHIYAYLNLHILAYLSLCIFQHIIVAPAPQTPRSEEWAWIECGRSTPCRRGEAL